MTDTSRIDVARLAAIDVHVHLEHTGESTDTDRHAAAYFKGGASRDPKDMADYYRSRNMALVVFTVDERLTGVPRPSNDAVVQFAAENPDIAIPFASIDPKGVGELMRIGLEKGRAARPGLEAGICGEHGGDPESIALCRRLGIDYVSCSPPRVPVARLAAAQAALSG